MTDYSISSTTARTGLGLFRKEIQGPPAGPPEPDPLATDLPPAMYYLGGRAGVWRSPTLYARTVVSLGLICGDDSTPLPLKAAGVVWNHVASSFAPMVTFSYPTDCVTFASPKNLGSFGIAAPFTVINNWAAGTQHYYQFTLTDRARLSVSDLITSSVDGVAHSLVLKSLGQRQYLSVTATYRQSDGKTVVTDYGAINTTAPFTVELVPGTYSIYLYRYASGDGMPDWPAGAYYTLAMDFLPSLLTSGPGTDYTTAYELGDLVSGTPTVYAGAIAANQAAHWFRVQNVTYGTSHTVTLTGLGANLDLVVYSNGNTGQVAASSNAGTTSESATVAFQAETPYWVKVNNTAAAASSYTLTLT